MRKTQLPWEFEDDSVCADTYRLNRDQGDKPICEEREGNVEFMNCACNEYESDKEIIKELVEALEGIVDHDLCSFDHHGYCQTHFSGSLPCLMNKARQILEKGKEMMV